MTINFLERLSLFFMLCGRILDSLLLSHPNFREGISPPKIWGHTQFGNFAAFCGKFWAIIKAINTGLVTEKMLGAYLKSFPGIWVPFHVSPIKNR
jgi:hypothetical protein